jgi:hydroxyacylglutathione hydrolase
MANRPPSGSLRSMARLPLEDNFNDILGKTRRGWRIQDSQITKRAGITQETLVALLSGDASDEPALRAVAKILGLSGDALAAMAQGAWYPEQPDALAGFAMFTTTFEDMTVNNFLVWDPETREAAAFDTGATCDGMLDFAKTHGLNIGQVFLTHAHPDHLADLEKLAGEAGAEVFTEEREPAFAVETQTFREGSFFRIGGLSVDAISTCGHSPGQTTFFITGLEKPVAVVGDSLFAGSMGGSVDHFGEQRRNTGDKILTLPADTILAPGHGPLTTVSQERAHNPFFAK